MILVDSRHFVLLAISACLISCDRSTSNANKDQPDSTAPRAVTVGGTRPAPHRKSGKAIRPADVQANVIQIMAEQFGVRKSELTSNVDLQKDLKADDLDRVELTMTIEDEFGLSISDQDADSWSTVGQVVDYVRTHLKP